MTQSRSKSTPPKQATSPDWPQRLVDWYQANKRDLPWRHTRDPYAILVSEIMLQQTRVDTVIPYYHRFLEQFPSLNDLAKASEQTVLKCWQGLGYYRRARNLHALAKQVQKNHQSSLPDTHDALRQLPGLGAYTSAAVASLAFGLAHPVIDGNVIRVFSRFWRLEHDAASSAMKRTLGKALAEAIQNQMPGDFNQAMMELGALICTPTAPMCSTCPLNGECEAYKHGDMLRFPIKKEKVPIPHLTIAVGIVFRKNKILVARRSSEQMLGGLWEFPGGKVEPGESLPETVQREVLEETGVEVSVNDALVTVKHTYSHFKITLTAFLCRALRGHAQARQSAEVRWVKPEILDALPFPKANVKVLQALTMHLNKQQG